MSAFLDRYHDMHHVGAITDLINCPHCQDEYMQWIGERVTVGYPVDRLEDTEV